MRLPEQFIEDVCNANDIYSVMSAYLPLKSSGHDYVCLCPFHSEKTPSCHVYTATQSFYCFGCGVGGNVISFMRNIENLTYLEAIEQLAERAGMAMPESEYDPVSDMKTKILAMNREAARFYRDILLSPEGQEGMRYLLSRGLSQQTIRKYGLGFAPDAWNRLRDYLLNKNFTEDEMISAALAVRSNNGKNNVYDKFRNRIMFPIINKKGNVIAFGGRTMQPDAPAKYINSDETYVFRKRENLFSINFAKNTKEKFMIMCEGYMDVISLVQAGFENTVASLGTAVTKEQANMIRQINECSEVILAYDSDGAGQKATMRAINLMSEAGITARVLKIEGAKDPDEYIRKFGPDGFRMLIEQSKSAVSFQLDKLKTQYNMDKPEGKAEFLKKAVVLLSAINNKIDRSVYISETAAACSLQNSAVETVVEEERRKASRYHEKEQRRQLIAPPKVDINDPEAAKHPAEIKAEQTIVAFALHSPELVPKILAKTDIDSFLGTLNKKVMQFVKKCDENGTIADFSALQSELSSTEEGKITGIIIANNQLGYDKKRLADCIRHLYSYHESISRPDPSEMGEEELRKLASQIKNKTMH